MSLPDFSALRILVAGDVMLDRYWQGACQRISPEAPVPVVAIHDRSQRLGGAANVSLNVRALGGQCSLLGLTGQDESAAHLGHILEEHGIRNACLTSASHPTITKLRVLSQNQQLIRLDFEQPFTDVESLPLVQHFGTQLAGHDLVILSDYAKGSLQHCAQMIQLARAQGIPVVVDPKQSDFSPYRGASVLKPNHSEFVRAAEHMGLAGNQGQQAESMRQRLELDMLLITCGEHGMSLYQNEASPCHVSTQAREVYDVTGAGDTVAAALALMLAAGSDPRQALEAANHAAGIVVGKLGTATLSRQELEQAIHPRAQATAQHLHDSDVVAWRQQLRAKNKRLVMSNGCFDLLHPGHINYLQQAAQLGDALLIAVNSDDSIKRLKGPERPIQNLAARMQVLAALQSVDAVIAFSSDTPAELIARVQPDILVKGGDYRVEDIAGADSVLRHGGQVRVLPLVAGHSSSHLIARAQHTNHHA